MTKQRRRSLPTEARTRGEMSWIPTHLLKGNQRASKRIKEQSKSNQRASKEQAKSKQRAYETEEQHTRKAASKPNQDRRHDPNTMTREVHTHIHTHLSVVLCVGVVLHDDLALSGTNVPELLSFGSGAHIHTSNC